MRAKVNASIQNQALSAHLFLYREVLSEPVGWIEVARHATRPRRHLVVLTREEVRALLSWMEGVPWLVASLLYGAGLRLLECSSLRVKDIDFDRNEIRVRDGKGRKDRVTMLPRIVKEPMLRHLEDVRGLHQEDLREGAGGVHLPDALARKYPNADREWGWQYVFPASSRFIEKDTGIARRHQLHESVVQKAIKAAVRRAGIAKLASCHTLRHYADLGIGGTALPHISLRTDMTSVRFRNC